MKVKAKININENGRIIKRGDIFDIDEDRARQLGDAIEEIEKVEAKEIEEPPKNKMIKKANKVKNVKHRK